MANAGAIAIIHHSMYMLSTYYLTPFKCALRFVLQHLLPVFSTLSLLKHTSRCKLNGEDNMC
jgi:hypothetical protein